MLSSVKQDASLIHRHSNRELNIDLLSVADLHRKNLDSRPPGGPNSFNFMQFLGKFDKIVCWRPPGELAPPRQGIPGSATGYVEKHS